MQSHFSQPGLGFENLRQLILIDDIFLPLHVPHVIHRHLIHIQSVRLVSGFVKDLNQNGGQQQQW